MSVVSESPSRGEVSDNQLVTLARAQNEDAFAHLVSRYSGVLHRLSAQYGNAVEPEDLAQEGLLGLLSAVKTYRFDGSATFSTYAYTCMRNRMLSVVRRIGSKPSVQPISDEPVTASNGTGEDPAALLVRLEELAALRAHLREVLSELEYRVLMRYLGSYSYEEIATELSVGRKTVDNALRRVRRKLSASPFPFRL